MSWLQVLISFLTVAYAGSLDRFSVPGHYKVIGTLQSDHKDVNLTLFRRSQSKTILKVVMPEDPKKREKWLIDAAPLIDQKVEVIGVVQGVKNQRGEITVEKMNATVSEPIDISEGDGFWLIKKM